MTGPLPLEDYALIGDGETAALVGRNGSIDWLCWPRFDSGACFAALLGGPDHGRWLVAPEGDGWRSHRSYRGATLVLDTVFESPDGSVVVTDFMPLRGNNSDLVRTVTGRRGRVRMRSELVLRFDYGAIVPWVTRLDDGRLRAVAGPDMVVLTAGSEVHGEDLTTVGEFSVGEGESVSFVLTWAPSHHAPPHAVEPDRALRDTLDFWEGWSSTCSYRGEWAEAVHRSLLTLKALIYQPTGGIVAAPTTSLPEQLGGARNWDYRFCWLRDATFTLLALLDAGYEEEAAHWRDWLLRAAAGSPAQAQIMYGIAGERRLLEWEVPWLPGYEGSVPVRLGNAAHAQRQLDVFGEVLDALYQAGRRVTNHNVHGWDLQRALVQHLEKIWMLPDQGLWEMRGAPQHFTHSKVMAWVALDRAVRSVEEFGLEGPLDRWRALRDRIHREICDRAWDPGLGSFVQSYGSHQLDASLLMMPLVGFLPPEDPRIRGTVACIEQRLLVNGFVQRYDTAASDDGLPPGEGAFLACSFWLADNYALVGRSHDARALFERLLALRNDVGLLAEEYDPRLQRQVGNFPQAFSHVALVGTALNLAPREQPGTGKPAHQRTGRE